MKTPERSMINVTKMELPDFTLYSNYLKKIWQTHWITNNGEYVQRLEKKLREYLKVKYLIVVANGTLALQLALKAIGVKGEVVTTPFTFPATTNVIMWEGAEPVFADIDPTTFTIDPVDVERKITKRTSAILAVHVYGNPCNVDQLQDVADRHNIPLLYDAAHCFGVEYRQKSILRYGDISTLSFHATKIFSTGEGGAIIVRNRKLYERIRLLRNFGIQSEEKVSLPGINAKMNELQAAIGLCNLDTIERSIQTCQRLYERYETAFKRNPSLIIQTRISSKHNYAYMPVCFESQAMRDAVYDALLRHHIKARKYFFPITSSFRYVQKLKQKPLRETDVRHAKSISGRVLCLPIYPSLPLKTVDRIIQIVTDAV